MNAVSWEALDTSLSVYQNSIAGVYQITTAGDNAEIKVTTARNGRAYQKFFMSANPNPSVCQQLLAHNETLQVTITGFYHYFERGFQESPDGKILSTSDGGKVIVVGFDDNGKNDDGARDEDFNDCGVRIKLKPI